VCKNESKPLQFTCKRVLMLKEAPKVVYTGLTERIGAPKDFTPS